ncbi:MAG: 2-isopropylmalate synthase [Acidobacteriaceae bacterium]
MDPQQIFFFDTTLRDGEQSPGCSMYMAEKVRMARQLELLGVDVIEAGFAIASDGDFAAVRQVAHEVKGPRICSLARAKEEDIVTAARALEPAAKSRIHIFLASSDIHLEYKLQISREQALELTDKSVRLARTYAEDVEFSPEDASRSDREFLCAMVQVAVDAGATVINLPDTVGYTVPHEYASMFRLMKERIRGVENIVLSSHCHNDLGLAVANSLAALEAGARQVECTINGIGERAGNAALEEMAAAIHVRHDQLPFHHNLDLKQLFPSSQLLSEIISFAPAPNKAVVGSNAFSHEAGIHQHGVMSNPLCYEIMTPAQVGVPANRMVLGKHSGRHALNHRLKELGYSLSRADLDLAYDRFVEVADRKKSVFDQDLVSIMLTHLRQSPIVGQHGSGGPAAVAAPQP